MIFEDVEEAPAAAAPFELRTYQAQWNEAIAADRASGFTRLLIDAPGGCGKTTVFAALAAKEVAAGGRVLVLENRDRLVDQTADRIRMETGLDVEVERADDIASPTAKVVVASVQTIGRVGRLTGFPDDHFTLVIPDECFPSNVTVDGRSIKEIMPGDSILTFNHEKQCTEYREVMSVSRSIPQALVELNCSGQRIVSTPGHPYFTPGGYKRAIDLKCGDQIARRRDGMLEMRHEDISIPIDRVLEKEKTKVRQVQKNRPGRSSHSKDGPLQELWGVGELRGLRPIHFKPPGDCRESGVLQRVVSGSVDEQEQSAKMLQKNDGIQSRACVQKNDPKQSDEEPKEFGEDESLSKRTDLSQSGRERVSHGSSDGPSGCIERSADGVRHSNCGSPWEIPVPPAILQGGYSLRGREACDRGGREHPQNEEVEVFGSQKDGDIEFFRVDGVTILERGSDGGYGEMCPDGFVYNLEVEGNHNYFANGVLVHNCHHALANQWRRILCYFHYGADSLDPDWLIPNEGAYKAKATIVGFTATPDIGEKKNLGEIFQKFSVRYSYLDAVNDGWLVPPITESIPVKVDLRKFKTGRTPNGSDFKPADLTAALVPIIEELAQQVVNRAADRKTIAFVPSIECAKLLAQAIGRLGLKAIFVSGECLDVSEKTDDFVKSGPGTVLCNAALYVEGADFPDIDCVAWFRATISRAFYIQGVYRGTRILPGILKGCRTAGDRRSAIARSAKPNVLILDPLFVSDRIDLCDAYDLFTDKPEVKAKMKATGDLSAEGAETAERDFIKSLEKAAKKAERKKARVINPLAWAVSMGDAKLASYRPETESERKPASEPQLNLLRQHHIDVSKITCAGLAHKMISIILTRHTMKLATPSQLDFLHKLGANEEEVAVLKVDEATALIDRLKRERGWN